jgi:hypothetical protein
VTGGWPCRRHNSRTGSQPQHTTGTTTPQPAAAGIDATLLAAWQILNNPPPSGASPSVAEQWRHDVNQLIVAAINTSHHERWRQPSTQWSLTPSTVHAPSVAHAPPARLNARPPAQRRTEMVSYMMIDLKEEINHCRGGEYNRTAIECHRERWRNIKGCNLEKNFDSHAPAHGGPVIHAPHLLTPREFCEGAWRLPHTCVWWSGLTCSSPTYQKSMTGRSTPLNSCRSTPPPSLPQGG